MASTSSGFKGPNEDQQVISMELSSVRLSQDAESVLVADDDDNTRADSLLRPNIGPPPSPIFGNSFLNLRRCSGKLTRERSCRASEGLKGPLRAFRLCILSILIPGLLVLVPLYMRFIAYGDQLYPLGASDMRLLDARVSTTWCQKQLVRANTTFNAFLMPEQPRVEQEPIQVSMTRYLELENDMKEYWAFYLLQGSLVKVSTCVRWPGASLVVIRGHKHLHECAYIGDNSSEEAEEQQKMNGQDIVDGQWPISATQDHETGQDDSNQPGRMRRIRPGVTVQGQKFSPQETLQHDAAVDNDDVDNLLVQTLSQIRGKSKVSARTVTEKPKPIIYTSATDVLAVLTTSATENTFSLRSEEGAEGRTESVLAQKSNSKKPASAKAVTMENLSKTLSESYEITTSGDNSNVVDSSAEIFEEVLHKLQKLGDHGRNILRQLNAQLGEQDNDSSVEALRNLLQELLNERSARRNRRRKRRNLFLGSRLQEQLNLHDAEENTAHEEGLTPDGIADHHQTVNETTVNDHSKSEYWSSFSSSEERLLNCAGLILNLPLMPDRRCETGRSEKSQHAASEANTLSYRVPRNGYYFFVFNSENEVKPNYLRVHFDLEKIVYNVSNSVAACKNSTESCSLPLDFLSSEKVVLEVPFSNHSQQFNEEFIAVSTCEPRTALYLCCVIAVPLFIILFAFQ